MLLAESLLKTVGFYKTGNVSLESGRETIVRHLEEKRYDFDGLVLADGSGLSRANKSKTDFSGEVFGRCDEREIL